VLDKEYGGAVWSEAEETNGRKLYNEGLHGPYTSLTLIGSPNKRNDTKHTLEKLNMLISMVANSQRKM
jgi:hypothetical protein